MSSVLAGESGSHLTHNKAVAPRVGAQPARGPWRPGDVKVRGKSLAARYAWERLAVKPLFLTYQRVDDLSNRHEDWGRELVMYLAQKRSGLTLRR